MSRDNDLAELARRALERPDTVSVMGHAVDRVARSLALDHVTILELSPADRRLRLRAGIGWGGGVVGTTIDAMPGGHVAYTLASPDPVVVDDMASEQRFAVSPQLLDAGVRSSLSVAIPSGGESPFGVIGAHATEPRTFTDAEAALVQGVAAIVGGAIANQRRALDVHAGLGPLDVLLLCGRSGDQRGSLGFALRAGRVGEGRVSRSTGCGPDLDLIEPTIRPRTR